MYVWMSNLHASHSSYPFNICLSSSHYSMQGEDPFCNNSLIWIPKYIVLVVVPYSTKLPLPHKNILLLLPTVPSTWKHHKQCVLLGLSRIVLLLCITHITQGSISQQSNWYIPDKFVKNMYWFMYIVQQITQEYCERYKEVVRPCPFWGHWVSGAEIGECQSATVIGWSAGTTHCE